MNELNKQINRYESKLISVELTEQNIEQIIGSLKLSINELSKHESKIKAIQVAELRTLLNYIESL